MAESEQHLSTGVDGLIKVVKEKGEISVKDAATALGPRPPRESSPAMPETTVEDWASFLEEENLLKIKYKFTKPFLVAVEEQKAEVDYEVSVKAVPTKIVPLSGASKDEEDKKKGVKVTQKFVKVEELKHGSTKKEELPEQLPESLDELMKLAEAYINQENFKAAQKIYAIIEKKYNILPEEFEKRKAKIIEDLLKLNRDWVMGLEKTTEKSVKEKADKIMDLLGVTKKSLDAHNLMDAIESFKKVEDLYRELPDFDVSKKFHFEEEIIQLQQLLIKEQLKTALKSWEKKSAEIRVLMGQLDNAISREDVDSAFKIYDKIDTIKQGLPQAFLEEKVVLENQILPYFETIMGMHLDLSLREVSTKIKHIDRLIVDAQGALEQGSIGDAVVQFDNAKKIYYSIPSGFLQKKVETQAKLLRVSRSLMEAEVKRSVDDLDEKVGKINTLLKLASGFLESKDFKKAHHLYLDIQRVYNAMPHGFIDKKTKLRIDMLNLYEGLFMYLDKEFMQDYHKKESYHTLLRLTMHHHDFVKSSDFSKMTENWEQMKHLLGNLDDTLAQFPQIRSHIASIQKEVTLFRRAESLKDIKKKVDLKKELDAVYSSYKSLVGKCPEDQELFSRIKKTYLKHTKRLKGKSKS